MDAVIDTGDLTSFGIDGESRIAGLIESFDAPYYLVPGNHDSKENRAALARYANLTVLDGDVVDIAGVRILGVADPGYTTVGGISREAAVGLRNEHADEVGDLVRRRRPDVLAVAGLSLADDSLGAVPLVISGDIHERSEHEEEGTRLLTVGSTGATGLGSFTDRRGPSVRSPDPPPGRRAPGLAGLRHGQGAGRRLHRRPRGLRRRLIRRRPA